MLPTASTALGSVSPTMCVRLACPAHVAFRQRGGAGRPQTTAPAAILGTIAHQAMELAVKGHGVDDAWSTAVEESTRRGEQPETIVGLRRTQLRYERRVRDALKFVEGIDEANIHCEESLVSPDGSLEGTPDLVVVKEHGCSVVDFKTGLVLDLDEGLPKADYERQIQIYAHLANATYGVPATTGTLLSFRQGLVDVDVSRGAIARTVTDVLERRRSFNDRVPGSQPALPGDATCTWCDHQATCDGYWSHVEQAGSVGAGVALRGTIAGDLEHSQNGLVAIQLDVTAGAVHGTRATVAAIPSPEAGSWSAGDMISLTKLRHRSPDHDVYLFTERTRTHRWS